MRECQQSFDGRQNIELFSLRILDRPVSYCTFPTWRGQCDAPVLLIVPQPSVLSFYTGLVLKGSADYKTLLWTIDLTEYVFLTVVIFVINVKDCAYGSYDTHNPRFDRVGGSLLFCLPVKDLDVLKYFVLYEFAQRMTTDPVFTVLAFRRCSEEDWEKTAVPDGSFLYDFRTVEVYGLEEESIPAAKRIRNVDGAPL